MSENKYYTPELYEFHIGFEYEMLNDIDNINSYAKYIYPTPFIYTETDDGKPDLVELYLSNLQYTRVKYLDKEDIISLGFRIGYEFNNEDKFVFTEDDDIQLDYDSLQKNKELGIGITIYSGILTCVPVYIKNKSELVKLLKQLNIH